MAPILRSTILLLLVLSANFFFPLSLLLSIALSPGEIGHLETKKLARVHDFVRNEDSGYIYIYLVGGVSELIAPRSTRTRQRTRGTRQNLESEWRVTRKRLELD